MPRKYGVKASVRVVVHSSLKELRQAHVPITGKDARNVMAFCHLWPMSIPRGYRRVTILADLHLAVKYLDIDTIVHEVTHAAIAWLAKDKQRFVSLLDGDKEGIEERFCDILGGLTQGIVVHLRKRGMDVYA